MGELRFQSNGAAVRSIMAALVAALVAGGCAFITTESGSETVSESPTTSAAVEDTTDDTTSDELATTDTTEPEPEPVGDPLPAGADANVLYDVIRDVHGPTDDVAAEVSRLIAHPELPSPTGAHIRELSVQLDEDDGNAGLDARVEFYADGSLDDLKVFYETEVPPLGWRLATTESGTDFEDNPTTELGFESIGGDDSFDAPELTVTLIADPRLDRMLVETRYRGPLDGNPQSEFERFLGWYDERLVLDGGEVENVSVTTFAYDLTLSMSTGLRFGYPGADADQLSADLTAQAESMSMDVSLSGDDPSVDATSYYPSFASYTYRLSTFDEEKPTLSVGSSDSAVLDYLDPARIASDFDIEYDLYEGGGEVITTYQIERVIRNVGGITQDVSEDMRRLLPFPDVPTPARTYIHFVGLSASEIDEETARRQAIVGFRAPGTRPDLLVFFETQFTAAGWEEIGRSEAEDDDGLLATTIEYDLASEGTETLTLSITEVPDATYTDVSWSHVAEIPAEEAFGPEFTTWPRNAPIPDGGRITAYEISENLLDDEGARFSITQDYEASQEELFEEVESLIPASDWEVSDFPATSQSIQLDNPNLWSSSILVLSGFEENPVIFSVTNEYFSEGTFFYYGDEEEGLTREQDAEAEAEEDDSDG